MILAARRQVGKALAALADGQLRPRVREAWDALAETGT
jgi:hypothetical protein